MTGLFFFNDMLVQKPQTRFSVRLSVVGKNLVLDNQNSPRLLSFYCLFMLTGNLLTT